MRRARAATLNGAVRLMPQCVLALAKGDRRRRSGISAEGVGAALFRVVAWGVRPSAGPAGGEKYKVMLE